MFSHTLGSTLASTLMPTVPSNDEKQKRLCALAWVHAESCPTLWSHGLWSARLLCQWDSPAENTGVGCHFLFLGIFPTQGSNPCLLCLLHWQVGSLLLCYLGSPRWLMVIQYTKGHLTPNTDLLWKSLHCFHEDGVLLGNWGECPHWCSCCLWKGSWLWAPWYYSLLTPCAQLSIFWI